MSRTKTEQNLTEPHETELNRTEQGSAEQNLTEEHAAGRNRRERNSTDRNRTKPKRAQNRSRRAQGIPESNADLNRTRQEGTARE